MKNLSYIITIICIPTIYAFASSGTTSEVNYSFAIFMTGAIIFAALIIGWATEAAQFYMSQGLALAILAWLQTLPEFAVEAVLAWNQERSLMIANFTGSLRLLAGFGYPLVFFTACISHYIKTRQIKKEIVFDHEHWVEVISFIPPLLYFILIYAKGSLSVLDGIILISFYVLYLLVLSRISPKDEEEVEDLAYVARKVVTMKPRNRNASILLLFLIGGGVIYFVAHPFIEGMKMLAVSVGVSNFIFIQWFAPFVTEFPEKITAFNWARKVKKAPIGIMNFISSSINQWTVLTGMLPMIYNVSLGRLEPLQLSIMQQHEILLTIVQGILAFFLLLELRITLYGTVVLFVLWLIQFMYPSIHSEMTVVYLVFILIEIIKISLRRKMPAAIQGIARTSLLGSDSSRSLK